MALQTMRTVYVNGAFVPESDAKLSIHDLSVMEIISPTYLRRHMQLADGDKVKLSFLTPRRSAS